MKKYISKLAVLLGVILIASIGCQEDILNKYPQYSALKYVPAGEYAIMSGSPTDVMDSALLANLEGFENYREDYEFEMAKFKEVAPLDPESITRMTVFTDDFEMRNNRMGVVIEVAGTRIDFTKIDDKFEDQDNAAYEKIRIKGNDVYKFSHKFERKDDTGNTHTRRAGQIDEIYLYEDGKVILVATQLGLFEKMLERKDGAALTTANSKRFIEVLGSMSYSSTFWCYLPADKFMDEVIARINEKSPNFKGKIPRFTTLAGGVEFSDALKFNLQAFNEDAEQIELTYDMLYGFRGMAMLASMTVPEIKEILEKIEITKSSGNIRIEGTFTQGDFETLHSLEGLIPKGMIQRKGR